MILKCGVAYVFLVSIMRIHASDDNWPTFSEIDKYQSQVNASDLWAAQQKIIDGNISPLLCAIRNGHERIESINTALKTHENMKKYQKKSLLCWIACCFSDAKKIAKEDAIGADHTLHQQLAIAEQELNKTVADLIKSGADVHTDNPLLLATQYGYTDVVKQLRAAGVQTC